VAPALRRDDSRSEDEFDEAEEAMGLHLRRRCLLQLPLRSGRASFGLALRLQLENDSLSSSLAAAFFPLGLVASSESDA
jgi:hypothetical protein